MALCFFLVPVSSGILLTFLIGSVMLIVGMMFFTLGAEISVSPMGGHVGAHMTKTRKLPLIIVLSFILGFIVTVSEPDLQVLAGLIPSIPNTVLIGAVAFGVAVFLVLALLRMFFHIPLIPLLIGCYALSLLLTIFVPKDFLCVAFDSGGVTTGPMTVPFIMALGVGVSAIRNDKDAASDSFGLIALCSIGPIIAVLILGIVYGKVDSAFTLIQPTDVTDSRLLWELIVSNLPTYIKEISISLLPILLFFTAYQIFVLHMPLKELARILVGLVYTHIGLVLFLTGANIGFMPAGMHLGKLLAGMDASWLLIPIGMVMGFFIVRAEPAVYVLNKQVSDMTDGNISEKAMSFALSIGVALSIGLAMLRVLTGISILYFLIPGYLIALGISFFVPKMYTAIAFDSGGVASGPMTAAFLVPFAQGACQAVGGNIVTDAFGIVAMVAMTPLITIQIMGLAAQWRKRADQKKLAEILREFESLEDEAIIPL
ncbi:MAG: DUF1538 domain-containing protein [Eubacteriales bacterium]|nr:DUF1538 domain-containing protein [Eubacteriales bacterium]